MDSGLSSLLMIAYLHGITADEAKLKHEFGDEPFSVDKLLLASHSISNSLLLLKSMAKQQ
jgi:subfamily B ATP-binding cassette protein HlyB/CyaB